MKENNLESNNIYEILKNDLLAEKISPEYFGDKLFELDQSSPERKACFENEKILLDEEVSKYFKQEEELQKKYFRFLGFTQFHIAQNLVGNNQEEALIYFEKSLESSLKGESDDPWIAYVEGTISYLKGQKIGEEVIERSIVKDGSSKQNNTKILESFNKGLEERGKPSYYEDYANIS